MKGYKLLQIDNIDEIYKIIYEFDKVFKPSLSERIVDLDTYAEKLYNNAIVFAAVEEDKFIGFIAFYANDKNMRVAYLAQIAVKSKVQNRKVGKLLLDICTNVSKNNGMGKLKLEVMNDNKIAIEFYERNCFKFCGEASEESKYMIKKL